MNYPVEFLDWDNNMKLEPPLFLVFSEFLLKLINDDISNVGNPTLYHQTKSIEKNIAKR